MVSSSVAGLPPGNVTVVDQTGRLLTQSDSAGRDLNASQLKFTSEVENRYQRRIENILAPMVGNGNVHAQVTAQVDFASREQTDEEYKPNQAANQGAVRSTGEYQRTTGRNQRRRCAGALSNQPPVAPIAPIEIPQPAGAAANNAAPANTAATANANTTATAAKASSSNSRHDQTTNFEVDRTIRHTQQQAGMVQRYPSRWW